MKGFVTIDFDVVQCRKELDRLRNKSTTEWGSRFEHGFSQLVDWFFSFDDHKNSAGFTKHFGFGHIEFFGMLLIGRSRDISDHDRTRLRWRSGKVSVNTHKVYCRTYDDLYETLNSDWRLFPPVSSQGPN